MKQIAATLRTYASGDYAFAAAAVKLELDVLAAARFDDSEEGRWRRDAENPRVDPAALYTNEFVRHAMLQFK